MSLFALIAALLLDQLKPLGSRIYLHGWLSGYVDYFQHHLNSGEYSHGRTAWWLAVLPVFVGAVLVFRGLLYLHPLMAWLFNAIVLYLCMGFRQRSTGFSAVMQALISRHPDEARELLTELRGRASHELNGEEVARIAIETILIAALHRLFGVVAWFVLFSLAGLGGAAGALFYCLGLALGTHWRGELNSGESGEAKFDFFARKMCLRLNWLPIRVAAATFSIVGNFEDTVYCWRSQASGWPDSETGILLASAAGASGVRLGLTIPQDGALLERPELGVGDKSGDAALQSTVQLLWRSTVFMLILLFMLTLAGILE